MTPGEADIVRRKYQSPRFGEIDPVKILPTAKALLIKISAITGWVNPEGPVLNVLVDQFTKKLQEGYRDVNADEMEYAFRAFGVLVQDWGKQVNLSLIEQVMNPYLAERREVSKKEEQKAPELPAAPDPESDTSDAGMIDWMNHVREQISRGKITVDFVPLMLYEWKKKRGEISLTKETKADYLSKAISFRQGQLIEAAQTGGIDATKKLKEFNEMKEARLFTGDHGEHLTNLCKKMVLFDILYLDAFRKTGS